MNTSKASALVGCVVSFIALGSASAAWAKTFEFTGTVQQCTPTCGSFAFLSAGSLLNGFIEMDDAAIADGTFTGADVTDLSFTVFDPASPPFGPSDPPNPVTDNPFTLDQTPDGGGIVVASGLPITNPRGTFLPCVPPSETGCVRTSAGTTDGDTLLTGFIDLWLTEGVLAANGATVTLRFDTECTSAVPAIPPPCFEVKIFENVVFVAGGDVAPASGDSDGDGVVDTEDNCTLVPNPDQRDTDGDNFGNVCDGDFNNDCIVNALDFVFMRAVFFTGNPRADLNGDGVVDFIDLSMLRAMRGEPPGPSGLSTACDP